MGTASAMNKPTDSKVRKRLLDRLGLIAPAKGRRTEPAGRRIGRFSRDERGVTLIEFGLLALPFFAIVGAILETALVFFATQVFDNGVLQASRLIRTGQAQTQGFDLAAFRSQLCGNLYGLFTCDQIRLKSTIIANFTSASVDPPVDEDTGDWTVTESFTPGSGNQIVLVQAYYKWPILLDLFGFSLKNLPDGSHLMASATVFRNEPF